MIQMMVHVNILITAVFVVVEMLTLTVLENVLVHWQMEHCLKFQVHL